MPGHEQDEQFDKGLPDYPLPEQIETLIDAGTHPPTARDLPVNAILLAPPSHHPSQVSTIM